MKTLGQIAYEAYFQACDSKLGGQEWFEKELPHIKAAWEAAAKAVALHPFSGNSKPDCDPKYRNPVRTLDLVGGECCKATTQTIKP